MVDVAPADDALGESNVVCPLLDVDVPVDRSGERCGVAKAAPESAETVEAHAAEQPSAESVSEFLPGGQAWPHAVYQDSKIRMEGVVPSREAADAADVAFAGLVGSENIIDEFTIDPTVPRVNSVLLHLEPEILFASESEVVGAQYLGGLDQLAQFLQRNPDLSLTVVGHADSQGELGYNDRLARRRAEAARVRFLANGIAAERVDTVSRGPEEPIGDNGTPGGRALNRRIEFAVIGI